MAEGSWWIKNDTRCGVWQRLTCDGRRRDRRVITLATSTSCPRRNCAADGSCTPACRTPWFRLAPWATGSPRPRPLPLPEVRLVCWLCYCQWLAGVAVTLSVHLSACWLSVGRCVCWLVCPFVCLLVYLLVGLSVGSLCWLVCQSICYHLFLCLVITCAHMCVLCVCALVWPCAQVLH